jgi:hypothetical protein
MVIFAHRINEKGGRRVGGREGGEKLEKTLFHISSTAEGKEK